MTTDARHTASFRDPAGFIFTHAGRLYRQINAAGRADYDLLMSSGLYAELIGRHLLVAHTEVADPRPRPDSGASKIIQPDLIPLISYPYEWSFSQLQDAALTTLAIQKLALRHGLTLKDASAYNIQYAGGRPLLIDTLSFTAYTAGEPWVAYKQFCQHFLAPLALMAKVDPSLLKLTTSYIDGLPLPLTVKLLPKRALLAPGLLMHLGLHAGVQSRASGGGTSTATATLSRPRLDALIDSLERTVRSLKWKPAGTEWGDYYSFTNYSDQAFEAKKALVSDFIKQAAPSTVWDLGGNTGEFSRLASAQGAETVCFDIDPVAVERNYRLMKLHSETNHLPLLLDLTNPSPSLGWANAERDNLAARGPADLVMALALVHHLAISNNLPLGHIAEYFAQLGTHLLIEFVPKSDSKVKILLTSRPDIFPDYTPAGFESAFAEYFTITRQTDIPGTERTLYLMTRRSSHARRA